MWARVQKVKIWDPLISYHTHLKQILRDFFTNLITFFPRNVEDMLRERGEEVCRVASPSDRVESAEQLELVPKPHQWISRFRSDFINLKFWFDSTEMVPMFLNYSNSVTWLVFCLSNWKAAAVICFENFIHPFVIQINRNKKHFIISFLRFL